MADSRLSSGSREVREAAYDAKLKEHGVLLRLEPFINSSTKILHRCLLHGLEAEAFPSNAGRGAGLKCCRDAAIRAQSDRRIAAAAAVYDEKIAEHGKVVRVDPYAGAVTPILHRCLAHGEEHLISPDAALQGKGLKCCRLAAVREGARRAIEQAAAKYDDELAEHGKVVRVEPYIDNSTKILHRCLEHDEEHPAVPANCRTGHGLQCCLKAVSARLSAARFDKAASSYDAALEAHGRVERVDAYAGSATPIRHRCHLHNEVHEAMPNNLRRGGGLACCRRATFSLDTVDLALSGEMRFAPENDKETSFYIYEMARFPGLIKAGISYDVELRSDEEYGECIYEQVFASRVPAFLVESVFLNWTHALAETPDELADWVGRTEIRRMGADEAEALGESLCSACAEDDSPWAFALSAELPLTVEQRRLVELKVLGHQTA